MLEWTTKGHFFPVIASFATEKQSMLFQHGRLNVNQLTELMPLSRPAVSHHLKLMLQAESVLVLAEFAEMGIDLLEIFGGNYESPAMIQGVKESTRRREAYFLDYAEKARQAIGSVPLIVTGGFRSRDAMEQALAEGSLDLVGIAKLFALIPDLPQRMLLGGLAKAELPAVRTGLGFIDRKLGLSRTGLVCLSNEAHRYRQRPAAETLRVSGTVPPAENIRQHRLRSERA